MVDQLLWTSSSSFARLLLPSRLSKCPRFCLTTKTRSVVRSASRSWQEQLVEVPTILYFLKQTVDIPVPAEVLQGFRPGQISTTSSSFSRSADEPFEGDFRTFPQKKKSARVTGQVSAELGAQSSSSTLSAHQMAPTEGIDADDDVWVRRWTRRKVRTGRSCCPATGSGTRRG